MKLPNSAHEAHPWVIAQIAQDFRLLDVWALPVSGDEGDFVRFLEGLSEFDPSGSGSSLSKALFWVRFRLGELFGWDEVKARPIPGCRETSLSERLPPELVGTADGFSLGALADAAGGFRPLYRTDEEWAAEISNDTVHGVMHLAWVEQADGTYRAQMGVYIKTRGRKGDIYMKLIEPFRHLIVYPSLMRAVGRIWDRRQGI